MGGATSIAITGNNYLLFGRCQSTSSNIIGNVFLVKTDIFGNLLFKKIFNSEIDEWAFDIKTISPNRYVLSLARDSLDGYIRSGKAVIIDSMANVIRSRLIPAVRYLDIYSILPLDNGDIIFSGVYDYYTYWTSHRYDVYALRTDSLLNFPPLPPIGISNNTETIPVNFDILSIYPNPFNPKTKIIFEIPNKSFVSIKIFDILGKEITVLVNENLQAGTYRISFNANEFNLCSGIYFCTLFAGGLKLTRKLILIK